MYVFCFEFLVIDSDSSLWAFYITAGRNGFGWKKDFTGSALMDSLHLIYEDETFSTPQRRMRTCNFFVRNSLVSWQDFIQADRNKTRSLTVWHHWYNWGGDYTTYHSGRVKPLYRKMSELSADDRFRILEIKKVTVSLCDNLRAWNVKTSEEATLCSQDSWNSKTEFSMIHSEKLSFKSFSAWQGMCGPINTSSVALSK